MANPQFRTLARRMLDADDVVLHTGPGVLSGTDLPARALAEAVWGDPEGRFTRDRFEATPEQVWTDWLDFWADAPAGPSSATPEPVHERVAELVEAGHVSTVVTENVFGLCREAGVPADRCIEFHGRADEARCSNCGRTDQIDPTRAARHRLCSACGRPVGPGVVLASEPPPRPDRLRAWARAEGCDVYLGAGTRFAVHPTAENAERAVETGADLLVVADRPTALDGLADHRLGADPATALGRLRDAVAILG